LLGSFLPITTLSNAVSVTDSLIRSIGLMCPITRAYCPAPAVCFVRKLRSLCYHFPERDLRTPRRAGDAVLALNVNLKVEHAHSRYDRLLAFAVDVDPERRVFILGLVERTRKVGSFIADRLDSH